MGVSSIVAVGRFTPHSIGAAGTGDIRTTAYPPGVSPGLDGALPVDFPATPALLRSDGSF
jgi:hypothetical protein